MPAPGPPIRISGPWFAPGNRNQRLGGVEREPCRPRSSISEFPARGSRPETEIKGLAGELSANRAGTRSSNLGIFGTWFAPGNRNQRPSGETSANRAGRPAAFSNLPVRGSRPENREQRFSGESSANRAGTRSSHLGISGPWFAPGNRNQRLSGESSANHAGTRSSIRNFRPWFAPRKPKSKA